MNSLEEFVYKCCAAGDYKILQNYWTEFVSKYGTDGYRIAVIKTSHEREEFEPINDIAYNTSTEWLKHYGEQGYHQYDPLVRRAFIDCGPFVWADVAAECHSPMGKRVISESIEFRGHNIFNGIYVARRIGPGKLVSTGLNIPSKDIKLNDTIKRELPAALFVFFARYREISEVRNLSEEPPKLTPRELDVLRWIALGWTKREVADRLSISVSCVKRHCENLSIKLGANNMPSAVARAMSYGLIVI